MDCGKDCVFGNEEGGDDALFIVLPAHARSLETGRKWYYYETTIHPSMYRSMNEAI
jgi:hypothetical protein